MLMELIFEIHDAEEGGFHARALGHAIFTGAETWEELRSRVLETVSLHFEDAHLSSAIGADALRGRVDSFGSRMKLPRGVSADRLIRALEHVGYAVIRQKGQPCPNAA